ncbi:MAG: hypothetical protein IPL46_23020 [Saprospiraceae bacterium]|nr:hypothetical protein [Saprospiraceae bacterium]
MKIYSLFLFVWFLMPWTTEAQDSPMIEMPAIRATKIQGPPDWAIMQQRLIAAMEEAGDFYWDRFTYPGGSTISEGPYDDLYEMFYNWPDFYIVGGAKRFYERAVSAYNGITRTNTPHAPDPGDYFHRLYKEFPTQDDFFTSAKE